MRSWNSFTGKNIINKEDIIDNGFEIEKIEKIDDVIQDDFNHEIVLCKKCGYQIFPDEKKCSYCGESRVSKAKKK